MRRDGLLDTLRFIQGIATERNRILATALLHLYASSHWQCLGIRGSL